MHPNAGGIEEGVRDRCAARRQNFLPGAGRRLVGVRNDDRRDNGSLVEPKDRIGAPVEASHVGLVEAHLLMKDPTRCLDELTLDLVLHRGGIHDQARIKGTIHMQDADLACLSVDLDFSNGGESKAKRAKGKVKEVAGKVLGDSKLKSEGKGDQVKGKVQNAIGGIKDTLRGK